MEDNKQKPHIEYEDSENWKGSGEQLSIKEICLRAFSKATMEGSKEMVSAGVDRKLIGGVVYEFPRPNQREIFINSVDMLRIILEPSIIKSRLKESFEEVDNETLKIDNEYKKKLDDCVKVFGETKISKYGRDDPLKEKVRIDNYNKTISNINEQFEFVKVTLSKKLLIVISHLLKEKNYFDEGGVFGD